ncbi:PD-(D/E)XK nuclease superfamily protein [bacterium A37T11]|nr:PD-(D/E)XK nuclease superfamily protein [bacterium A37T11]
MNRKYPIGLQSFRKIREDGYMLVDKTENIHQLVTSGKYYFLSRPRRFGKSLLLNTIKELFSGSKELFEGLWIADQWNWEQKHPVIHLRVSLINYQGAGLYKALNDELDIIASDLGLVLEKIHLKEKFRELIEKAAADAPVVILVDEYDKPIIDYLDNQDKVLENKEIFRIFYSVLKDSDDYIQLLMITGVSRFSRVGIFSELNNIKDISLHPNYTTLVGITQKELESNFEEEISAMQEKNPDVLEKIKSWYNGYSWGGTETLYNPFSILNLMDTQGTFRNYWINTGMPTFLVTAVRKHPERYLFGREDILVGADAMEESFVDTINPVTMLYQAGFLTIKSFDEEQAIFNLGYPNREVEQSMLSYLTAAYSNEDVANIQPTVMSLKMAFSMGDIPKVIKIIDTLFIKIPNPLWKGHNEALYHGIIQNTFDLLGIHMESEVHNALGRIDIVVKTATTIYGIEFKLEKSANTAIQQIFDRDYLKVYQLDPRKKVAIGINFSSEKKAVADFKVEELQS